MSCKNKETALSLAYSIVHWYFLNSDCLTGYYKNSLNFITVSGLGKEKRNSFVSQSLKRLQIVCMFHNLIPLSRQPHILPSSVGAGCREELHPSLAPQAGLGSCSWGLSLQAVLAWSSSGTSEEIHMREPICCVHHRN